MVSTISRIAGISVALIAVAACGREAGKSVADEALARDLKLASDANLQLANQQAGTRYGLKETAPKANLTETRRPKPAPGPRVVASPAPTLAAEPVPIPEISTDLPPVQTDVAPAPVQVVTVETVPAVSRPTPQNGGYGDIGGSGPGTIFGGAGPRVVIRGGGMGGDDDHCEPVFRPGTGGSSRPTGVYYPNPTISINRPMPAPPVGGVIGSRPSGSTIGTASGGGATRGTPRRTRGG
jgi:hypothetical protein